MKKVRFSNKTQYLIFKKDESVNEINYNKKTNYFLYIIFIILLIYLLYRIIR